MIESIGNIWMWTGFTVFVLVALAVDLVVLDRDPFEGPDSDIGRTRVTSTWVEGDVVFTE